MSTIERMQRVSKEGHNYSNDGFVVVQLSLTDVDKLLAVVEAAAFIEEGGGFRENKPYDRLSLALAALREETK